MDFIHIKYDKFIQGIINTRGQWNISNDEYFEVHHIIPKCMGGKGYKLSGGKMVMQFIFILLKEIIMIAEMI